MSTVKTEYQILEAGTADELVEKVEDAHATGWLCQGGVAVASYTYKAHYDDAGQDLFTYAQAMVKYNST